MVNVVCNAVCTDDGTNNPAAATYLKNSIVSLASAVGDELEKILFTNIRDIPEEFQKIMSRHNIKIMFCPFDYFRYQENIPWKLAFYKLNAIKWACEKLHFEKLMLLDTDTVCIKPLDVVFNECRSLMLYYVGLSSQCTDHKVYIDEWKRFFDEDFVGNYWGGGVYLRFKDMFDRFYK